MKKRLIAILCLLALIIGIFALTATAAGTEAPVSYDVGYAKINITPYVWYEEGTTQYEKAAEEAKFTAGGVNYCYSDSDGDGIYDVLHLPLRGSGSVWNRPGTTVIDDNGDGKVDLNDGLFITCMSVTDSKGKTVLFVSADVVVPFEVSAMRTAAVSRLKGKVTSDCIYYAGTHTHTAPDLSVRGVRKGNTNPCVDTFADPDVTHTFTYDDMNTDLETWYGHLEIAMADVTEQAYNSRAAATVTKGEIEASGENTGNRTMVSTRHYLSKDSNGEEYYNGDNFNPRVYGTAEDIAVNQVTQADETLYMLKFTFADEETAPIAFTNWRGHPTLNNTNSENDQGESYNGNRNCYSSDFINPYRYELGKQENGGYRVIYFNGTGGNTNPGGCEWNAAYTGASSAGSVTGAMDNWWINNEVDENGVYQGRAITYGRRLADVALKCLDNNMSPVTGGDEIRTYQYSLSATRQKENLSDLAYYACEAAKTYYAAGKSGVFHYPAAVTSEIEITSTQYDTIRTWAENNGATNLDSYAGNEWSWSSLGYTYTAKEQFYIYAAKENLTLAETATIIAKADSYVSSGEYYNVASKFHASSIVSKWVPTNGDVPGHPKSTSNISMELNAFVLGDHLAFVTVPGEPFDYYDKDGSVDPKENDWLELINDDTYGTPFILGYCNGSNSYIPNTKAYTYNEGSETYAVGCYESNQTALEKGTGEQMVQEFKRMLSTVSDEDYHYEAVCEHCGGENVTWVPYVKDSCTISGHYYLTENWSGDQVTIPSDVKICLDLNGKTFKGNTRAFTAEKSTNCELSIMDTSVEKTGRIEGCGGKNYTYGGAVVHCSEGLTFNLYGGTMAKYEKEGYGVSRGGVVLVRGTFNMYGGRIEGGQALNYGASVDLRSTFNMYGGEIANGTITNDTGKGSCIYADTGTTVNLYGGNIHEILFASDMATSLTVHGSYTGTAKIAQNDTTFDLGAVVGKTAAYNDVAADVSFGNITVGDTGYYAAIKGSDLVVAPQPYTYGTCEACGECQWRPMTQEEWEANYNNKLATGHYKLIDDVSSTHIQLNYNLTDPAELTVCVDLAGHTFTGKTRAFLVDDKAKLNIMDSAGNGILQSTAGEKVGGGVLYVYDGAEVNLYSGTVQFASKECLQGGIAHVRGGTMNVYGGTIIGANVTGNGGAILVNTNEGKDIYGKFIAKGGKVIAGEAGTGACIYVVSGCSAAVSGDAQVADIYFASSSADTFTVEAPFTGSAKLTYKTAPAVGTDLGNFTGDGTLAADAITVTDRTDKVLKVVGSDLILSEVNGAQIGEKLYGSLSDALAEYQDNDVIVLLDDARDAVTFNRTVYLDLNGSDVSGNVTVNEGYTLYCKDSQTDDFDVEDDNYGKLTGTLNGDIQAVEQQRVGAYNLKGEEYSYKSGYLKITEDDGTSFHALNLKLTQASLKPYDVGFYYRSAFEGDQVIQRNLETYGVALSVAAEPTAENLETHCEYSKLDINDFNTGSEGTGTLLEGVMKTTNYTSINRRNAAMKIHGKSYIKLKGNTIVFGDYAVMSLQEMLEKVDETQYTQSVPTNAKDLYNTYTDAMSRWNIANIKKAVAADKAAAEAETWKVLVLGNSHSLDATNMLYEVFQAENPDQKLVLGVLYRDGCKMNQHASYASGNSPEYIYYKNDGSEEISNGASGWIKYNDSTMLDALQDEQWDVVMLQEMNTDAGLSGKFEDTDIKSVVNYVKRNAVGSPKFMWNLIWTNPEIPDYDEAENAWIYKVQKPADYDDVSTWEAWYDYYNDDSWTMYDSIVGNVQTYVEGQYGIEEIITSGTAIQHAKKLLVEQGLTLEQAEKVLHRDYTHMNDYGRLMVSYLWYAQLMEYFDSDNFAWDTLVEEGLKYTNVPADMLHAKLAEYAPDGMLIKNEAVALDANIGADVEVNLYQLLIDAVTYAIESTNYAVEAPTTAQ